ncbi:hypothetical protein DXG01_009630 [Tephrocybe rancida]|nr:hypothetical protein DXG01_009630 [Tephrocybe rancida]
MGKDAIPLFKGTYTGGEKPHHWLRRLEGQFELTTALPERLHKFTMHLDPGNKAEQWYKKLGDADKASWNTLLEVFGRKWPLAPTVEHTRDELLHRLERRVLLETEIGQLVGDKDEKIYTHVKWAQDIRVLADALEDDRGHLISNARRGLPLMVRRLLPSSGIDTWDTFLAAVTTLSPSRIEDELEQEAKFKSRDDWQKSVDTITSQFQQGTSLQSASKQPPPTYQYANTYQAPRQQQIPRQQATPGAPFVRQTPPHASITTPQQQNSPQPATPQRNTYTREQSNPFISPTPIARGNLFNPQTPGNPEQQTPSRVSNMELAKRAIEFSKVQPNTAEGVTAYREELRKWEEQYGTSREVDFMCSPYPLTPGTQIIGSRECFKCGHSGHISRFCDNPTQISMKEQRWRGRIAAIMFDRRPQMDNAGVSQINVMEEQLPYEPAIYDAGSIVFEEEWEEQGNGAGARA